MIVVPIPYRIFLHLFLVVILTFINQKTNIRNVDGQLAINRIGDSIVRMSAGSNQDR